MRKIILSLATAALIAGAMGATAGTADAGPRHPHWHHGHWHNHMYHVFHMRMHGGRNEWRREHFHPQICGWRVDYRHHRGTVWRCSPALMTR